MVSTSVNPNQNVSVMSVHHSTGYGAIFPLMRGSDSRFISKMFVITGFAVDSEAAESLKAIHVFVFHGL